MWFSHGNCSGAWVAAAPAVYKHQGGAGVFRSVASVQGRPVVINSADEIYTCGVFVGT